MKIHVSYTEEDERKATLEALRRLAGVAKVKSKPITNGRGHVYAMVQKLQNPNKP